MAAIVYRLENRSRADDQFGNDMFYHHVLISGGRVYINRRDFYSPTMVSGLHDILDVAPFVPDVEFVLCWADAYCPTTQSLRKGMQQIPMLSYSKLASQTASPTRSHVSSVQVGSRQPDLMVPCYYDGLIDKICESSVPAFSQRKTTILAAVSNFCPAKLVDRAAARMQDSSGAALPGCPRAHFANISRHYPRVLDLRITFWDDHFAQPFAVANVSHRGCRRWKCKAPSRPVRLDGHARWAFLLDTDGLGRSCKFELMLAMGSVVLKPRSPIVSHFEHALVPWVHYVPLLVDAPDDILAVHRWLVDNPVRARRIADAGRDFACRHLTRPARRCVWASALREYRSLLTYAVPGPSKRPMLSELHRRHVVCATTKNEATANSNTSSLSLHDISSATSFKRGGCRLRGSHERS